MLREEGPVSAAWSKNQARNDPAKLALAARLRRETTLTIRQIAQRLEMGSWKSLNHKLYLRRQAEQGGKK